ncbi:PQQ-binding-like beta-propeller repeat protein [Streptomycetaceae bacterium NBC_01309]
MADDVGPGTPKPWTGYLLRAESLHVLDGVLYAGGDRLAAFEATTGRTLWTRGSGRILSTAGERYLYVDCRDGTITAINRLTGEDVWSRTRPRWLRGPRPVTRLGLSLQLRRHLGAAKQAELVDGLLICAFNRGFVAFDADTGRRIWGRFIGNWRTDTVVADRTVPIIDRRWRRTAALHPRTGRLLWHAPALLRQRLPNRDVLASSADEGWALVDPWTGKQLVGLRMGQAYPQRLFGAGTDLIHLLLGQGTAALDARSGVPVWVHEPGHADDFGSPEGACATDEAVYVADAKGRVRALDPLDGTVRWTGPPWVDLAELKHWYVHLVVDGNAVVAVAGHRRVAVLDRTTGELLWNWSDPSNCPPITRPAVAVDADRVYIAGVEHVYALPIRPAAPAPTTTDRPR